MKGKVFFFLAALLLTGCATGDKMATETVAQMPNTEESELDYHPDRYTVEQKTLLAYWWGEDWDAAVTDGMIDSALLGTGEENGHKTSGIAMGYSYEGTKADIPKEAGDKLLTSEVIDAWEREGKDFRLEETALYQRDINWGVDISGYEHTVDWDMEAGKWNPEGFRIVLPVDSVCPCKMTITGGVSDDRILIVAMTVAFENEQGDTYGGSVRHYMNYIRTVLEEENHELEQVSASVMSGSADKEGCYLVFFNGTDDEYKVPEQALLDGTTPVKIKTVSGDFISGQQDKLVKKAPRMDFYVEWNSLEQGGHELTVELQAEDGRKKQVSVPFTYETDAK